jgi:hypothetical protein
MGLTNSQKSLLHKAKSDLGMDEDTYREMLYNLAGVRSSLDMNQRGFEAVMQHLGKCGFVKTHATHEFTGYVARKKKWDKERGNRAGMATTAQLSRIETDWDMLAWYWAPKGFGNKDLALRAFLQRVARVSDLHFLSFAGAVQVITTLKKIEAKRSEKGGE